MNLSINKREAHDFSRAGKSSEILRASAPEVRFWVAQRFSAAIHAPFSFGALAAEVRQAKPVRRALHAILLTAAVFLFVGASPSTDARFKDLGHRMMCTCGCGQVLLECNHVGCKSSDKMRDELMAALDKGDNDDLILQGFVQNYGPTVIAAPTATGFNRVAWIMPFVALAAGIIFVTWLVRAWKNRPEPALADGITILRGGELDQFRAQARKETEQ